MGGDDARAGVDRSGVEGRGRGSPTSRATGCAAFMAARATIAAARRSLAHPARIGAGPTRFCALAAALAVRSRRPLLLDVRRRGAGLPAARSSCWASARDGRAPRAVIRLGPHTRRAGRLGRPALSDRFGEPGVFAHRLACAEDSPLRPRRVEERLEESMEVGDASSGTALRARAWRAGGPAAGPLRASWTHAAGGVPFRAPAGWRRLARACCLPRGDLGSAAHRPGAVSAPADAPRAGGQLGLAVEGFGPPASEQGTLGDQDRRPRPGRRAPGARRPPSSPRALAGHDAALRAVCVDPDSRVPERRVGLAPIRRVSAPH